MYRTKPVVRPAKENRHVFARLAATMGNVKRRASLLRPPRFFVTTCGAWTLLAVLALLLIAINYGNNLVFATAFFILALFLQAGWRNWRALRGLEVRLIPAPPVFAGDTAGIEAELSFRAARAREGLHLCLPGKNDKNDEPCGGGCSDRVDIEPAERGARLALPWHASGRGWRTLDGVALSTTAPLGLWRSRRALGAVRMLVYPRPGGDALPPRIANAPAHGAPQAESFAGVREYAPGDSLTRINWRIYGRRGELATNVFDGAAGAHARQLSWNDTDGDTETRLSQLARWVLEADSEGGEYRLELPGGSSGPQNFGLHCTPNRGPEHRDACLAALALFGGGDSTDGSRT